MRWCIAPFLLVCVAFFARGRCLAQEPHLWATLEGHTTWVTSVAFSPDNRMVASGSIDGRIKLWEVSTGKLRATLNRNTDFEGSLAFSHDGTLLAWGTGAKTIKLWDMKTGKGKATLK